MNDTWLYVVDGSFAIKFLSSCVLSVQLLDTGAVGVRREKMYKLDDHVACAVAGITGELFARFECCWALQTLHKRGVSVQLGSKTLPRRDDGLIKILN